MEEEDTSPPWWHHECKRQYLLHELGRYDKQNKILQITEKIIHNRYLGSSVLLSFLEDIDHQRQNMATSLSPTFPTSIIETIVAFCMTTSDQARDSVLFMLCFHTMNKKLLGYPSGCQVRYYLPFQRCVRCAVAGRKRPIEVK
jgi:hypothetical protein